MDKKTRPRRHWSEQIKQIVYAIIFAVVVERAFPTPWLQSPYGEVAWAFITFYVLKAWVEYRQSVSPRFYKRTQKWSDWIAGKRLPIPDFVRYRIGQVWRFVVVSLAIGYLIDMSTPACEGALNCAVAIPNLVVSNFAELIQFMIRLAMAFAGILGIQEITARQGWGEVTLPHSIKTRFKDVYGQDKAVESVKEALAILNKPEEVEALGGYMPTGIMMYGPPGVGKSWLAEAAAGEANKPFITIDGTSFSSMWAGVPQRRVKLIFKKLRKYAMQYGGCVVFFDEIDVLGSRGGGVLNAINDYYWKFVHRNVPEVDRVSISSGSGALQQLLTEMSGMKKSRGFYNRLRVWLGFQPLPPVEPRILWLAATNLEGALDPALLRPGRFDRKLRMGYPNMDGRIETVNGYLNKIHKHTLTETEVKTLSRQLGRATGASIKALVNEGLLGAVREGRDYITYHDLRDHMIKLDMGEVEGRFDDPHDRRRVALHEAAHAVASHDYRPEAPIQFASVVKRGKTGGFVQAQDDVDRMLTKSRMIANIKVSLASLWAENYFFADNPSIGTGSDLRNATHTVLEMISQYAMYKHFVVVDRKEIPEGFVVYADEVLEEIYKELSAEMEKRADAVEQVAALLDEFETIDGDQIHQLLEAS